MSEDNAIQVNFGKAMPLFPLDAVVLLPQQVIPLHIFEPRYRQMVAKALDGAGQIAMASFQGDRWKQEYHGRPPLRPAVCVGQIVQHERLADGRYNILVQGVCRARIVKESAPTQERLYREAKLEPVGIEPPPLDDLVDVRETLDDMLSEGPLSRLNAAEPVLKFIRDADVPVTTLLEVVSFTMLSRAGIAYQLLAEADAGVRAKLILDELHEVGDLIRRASQQRHRNVPKGCSWN